jgi:hypothetical protein
MDRHWDANGAASAPSAPVNALGSNVYPQGGASPSLPGPWWFHMVAEELRNLIVAGGLTPDRATLTQLASAVSNLAAAGSVGKHTLYIPASAMIPRITAGAAPGLIETATNKIMLKTLDFDAATAEYAQFSVRMPKSWNESTVNAFMVWSNVSGTGNVVWGIQGVALSNDDVLDAAFGSAVTVTDGVTAAGDLMQTDQTGNITIGGSPAANDWVVFQVYRAAADGADTLAVDARLHGVVLVYTTDASTDA